MNCLECNKKLPKNRRKFCCNKHKDRYHNTMNPRGWGTRVHKTEQEKVEDEMHPCDPYSLGQE